jgi:TDG/mug DNA glycosylase family protein
VTKARNLRGITEGFAPILGEAPAVLVLGTLPSQKSLEKSEYYGHPQNGFWKIMATLVGAEGDYERRCRQLIASRIAVWDVLAASVRPGSMDADIDMATATANPLAELVNAEITLERVCFNGQAAAKLFRRLVPVDRIDRNIDFVTLPSTSPAYAAMSLAEKTRRWREALAPSVGLRGR